MIPLERTKPALDLTVLFNGFKPLFQALSPEDVNKLSVRDHPGAAGRGRHDRQPARAHGVADHARSPSKDKVIGEVIDNLNTVLDTVNSRGERAVHARSITLQQLVSGLAAGPRADR